MSCVWAGMGWVKLRYRRLTGSMTEVPGGPGTPSAPGSPDLPVGPCRRTDVWEKSRAHAVLSGLGWTCTPSHQPVPAACLNGASRRRHASIALGALFLFLHPSPVSD